MTKHKPQRRQRTVLPLVLRYDVNAVVFRGLGRSLVARVGFGFRRVETWGGARDWSWRVCKTRHSVSTFLVIGNCCLNDVRNRIRVRRG